MRSTHTLAQLPVSPEAFTEIRDALIAAGYDHAVLSEDDGTMLDMTGIGLVLRAEAPQGWDGATATGPTDEDDVDPTPEERVAMEAAGGSYPNGFGSD